MKFSLIMATVGRTTEIARFLDSLALQNYHDYELIIVDQNQDDRLFGVINRYKTKLCIKHVWSKKGLSRARNVGMKYARGAIVAFPDDDCWYPSTLLRDVASRFADNRNIDGLTGRSIDLNGTPTNGRWPRKATRVNRLNVWKTGISYTIFLEKAVLDDIGLFDESLGAGADSPWGSGEETDYLIRAIDRNHRIFYDPALTVYHQHGGEDYNKEALSKVYKYGAGMGKVLHKQSYPYWFWIWYVARPCVGILISCLKGNIPKANLYYRTIQGRIRGWISHTKDAKHTCN